ncbi:MAG: hypothetical protein BMS9Abin37_0739 [Acidobacteriota bacterium]|nr:MAG: hypothetical protein BMS9Abin37_0739 [Acidobacteriota bacterium]
MSNSSHPPRYPQPAAGLVLFIAVVGIALAMGRVLPEGVALAAMPVMMLLATGLAVIGFRVDAKETLLLRLPSATDFLMAMPLAISFFILDDQIAGLSHARFPVSEATLEYFRRILTVQSPWDWVEKIALIGLAAAVSEELMFRGFMQTAFLQRLRRPAAIVLAAALFMLLHVQFLPVLAAGVVLGFVALATKSIVIPMFVHFTNNVIQLALFNLAGLETLGDPVWIPPTILLPALAMFALSWGYYLRRLEPEPQTHADAASEHEHGRITIPHDPTSIGEELSSVPEGRRRLGWLVVAMAVVTGVLVLIGLFGWSVYYIYPERMHARGIGLLERRVTATLEPGASDKAARITSAFRALEALNESGQLELRDLAAVRQSYRELSADGGLDAQDADTLVEAIHKMVTDRTRPRTF